MNKFTTCMFMLIALSIRCDSGTVNNTFRIGQKVQFDGDENKTYGPGRYGIILDTDTGFTYNKYNVLVIDQKLTTKIENPVIETVGQGDTKKETTPKNRLDTLYKEALELYQADGIDSKMEDRLQEVWEDVKPFELTTLTGIYSTTHPGLFVNSDANKKSGFEMGYELDDIVCLGDDPSVLYKVKEKPGNHNDKVYIVPLDETKGKAQRLKMEKLYVPGNYLQILEAQRTQKEPPKDGASYADVLYRSRNAIQGWFKNPSQINECLKTFDQEQKNFKTRTVDYFRCKKALEESTKNADAEAIVRIENQKQLDNFLVRNNQQVTEAINSVILNKSDDNTRYLRLQVERALYATEKGQELNDSEESDDKEGWDSWESKIKALGILVLLGSLFGFVTKTGAGADGIYGNSDDACSYKCLIVGVVTLVLITIGTIAAFTCPETIGLRTRERGLEVDLDPDSGPTTSDSSEPPKSDPKRSKKKGKAKRAKVSKSEESGDPQAENTRSVGQAKPGMSPRLKQMCIGICFLLFLILVGGGLYLKKSKKKKKRSGGRSYEVDDEDRDIEEGFA